MKREHVFDGGAALQKNPFSKVLPVVVVREAALGGCDMSPTEEAEGTAGTAPAAAEDDEAPEVLALLVEDSSPGSTIGCWRVRGLMWGEMRGFVVEILSAFGFFAPLEDCVSLFEGDVDRDLQDGVVHAMVLVVGLEDVPLGRGPRACVLGQVHVGEAQLPEVATALLLLKQKKPAMSVCLFCVCVREREKEASLIIAKSALPEQEAITRWNKTTKRVFACVQPKNLPLTYTCLVSQVGKKLVSLFLTLLA